MQKIVIKSFHGIGDLLFATPSFRVIKEAYPSSRLIVNTHRPGLLINNPFVDKIGSKREGPYLAYPDPDSKKKPYQHHILSDWEIICRAYNLKTKKPLLRPELYIRNLSPKRDIIGVQIEHKGHWHNKKMWPYFKKLAGKKHFEPIPHIKENPMINLVRKIAEYKCVVCAEGGISHIAKALNIPAVVIYGGFANPLWNGYEDQINLVSDVNCRYCYNEEPCKNDYKCWKQIPIELVEKEVLKI